MARRPRRKRKPSRRHKVKSRQKFGPPSWLHEMNETPVTVLVAGENFDLVVKMAEHFRAEKYRVVPVTDQSAIITITRVEEPGLIVLDFKATGFDFCRMLKRNFITEHIPVILLLDSTDPVDRVVALELGADDCLTKPFGLRELHLRARACLKRAREKRGRARYEKGQHFAALTRKQSLPPVDPPLEGSTDQPPAA